MGATIMGNVSDHYDAYRNIRFKSCDQGVMWLEDDAELLSISFGYSQQELVRIIGDLEHRVDGMVRALEAVYKPEMDRILTGKEFTFAIIGCSFSSEYLSYFNAVRKALAAYPGIRVIDAAVTAETVTQTVAHIYNRVLKFTPDISSLFMGINDMRRNLDVYSKNNVSPREFRRDVSYLVKVLRRGGGDVILHTLTPCNIMVQEKGSSRSRWTYRVDDWDVFNDILREIADLNCCVLNDQTAYLKQFSGTVNIPENGLHITPEAQEFLGLHFMDHFLKTVEGKYGS